MRKPSLPSRFQQLLTLAATLVLVLFTVCWNIPQSALSDSVKSVSQYVMYPLRLDQNWHMFTTDATQGFSVRTVEGYADGKTYVVPDLDPGPAKAYPSAMREFINRVYEERQAGYLNGVLRELCTDPQGPYGSPAWVRVEVATFPVAQLDNPVSHRGTGSPTPPPSYQPSDYVRCR